MARVNPRGSLVDRIFMTDDNWTSLVLRLGLGLVMFPHGAQKALGWFGGSGFTQTLSMFTTHMHLPAALTVLVIAAEFLGPLGLIVGLFTRIAAFGLFCNMVGAVALVHWKNGFFMNWMGKQPGEGFEYHLLAIAIALALMIAGGGRLSLDRALARRLS
jgi:putative oxidoreductase